MIHHPHLKYMRRLIHFSAIDAVSDEILQTFLQKYTESHTKNDLKNLYICISSYRYIKMMYKNFNK